MQCSFTFVKNTKRKLVTRSKYAQGIFPYFFNEKAYIVILQVFNTNFYCFVRLFKKIHWIWSNCASCDYYTWYGSNPCIGAKYEPYYSQRFDSKACI